MNVCRRKKEGIFLLAPTLNHGFFCTYMHCHFVLANGIIYGCCKNAPGLVLLSVVHSLTF